MQKETAWKQAEEKIRQVRSQGGFSNFMAQHPKALRELDEHACDCVCCMDGRVAPFKNAIAIAGSGILIKDDPEARAQFVNALKARGIKKLTSHEGCGALSLYAKANGLTPEEAERHMAAWLAELATELGSTGKPERIPVALEFHNEVCAYIIMTERFSFGDAHEQLPIGFEITAPRVNPVVSRRHLIEQVQVALDIAFGDHGFGERFTEESPFSVVVVANDEGELARVQAYPELTAIIDRHGGRAVVDGFVLTGETEEAIAA